MIRIADPYAGPGRWCRAQLHCHTHHSDGRRSPADLARRYRDAGYTFVVFTDHDRITRCDDLNDATFLALPGVEETVTWGIWPLGPHLGRLLVEDVLGAGPPEERIRHTLACGGVPSLHHPSWTGNFWTGAWTAQVLARLPTPFLVEIWNPHSHPEEDLRRWLHAVRAHGPGVMVVASAGDDYHVDAQFDRAWVVVKVDAVTPTALRRALLGGACYASTGVTATFGVEGPAIVAHAEADEVLVLDAAGRLRRRLGSGGGTYLPEGDEGFVRLECRAGVRRAWSQVFWISAAEGEAGRAAPVG
ncbi:MAG: CehA/McbA family metallohydrolase [Armatimonadota bacterium]|nr:CehA/McbA family metallohydrolase [Armatimonadota bacterium]